MMRAPLDRWVWFVVAAAIGIGSQARAQTDGWKPVIKSPDATVSTGASQNPPEPVKLVNPAVNQRPSTSSDSAKNSGDVDQVQPPGVPASSSTERTGENSLVEQYCRVAVDAAVAGKLQVEKQKAEAIKRDIENKTAELNEATRKLQHWLTLRDDFRKKATDGLVSVYAQMDAEAAAQRLTVIGEPIAAAILMKLPPKAASAVLGEMQPDMAGKITAFMAGAAEVRNIKADRSEATR